MFLDKIIQIMKKDYPLYKNLKLYGFYDQLSFDELTYVFSGIFGEPVLVYDRSRKIYNQNGKLIYYEHSDGSWSKREYDDNGKLTYREDSNGYWEKFEYDNNGNQIYYESSNGYWDKYEYDNNGNMLYYEDSYGKIIDIRWKI